MNYSDGPMGESWRDFYHGLHQVGDAAVQLGEGLFLASILASTTIVVVALILKIFRRD